MFITIINDCHDQNAMARQSTRLASFFNTSATTVGVNSFNEFEAGAHLIDVLDAGMGADGVILVNVAPRHGKGKKWPNGTPFSYFWYKQTLVVSTVDGYSLSLVKKLGLTDSVEIVDLPTVIDAMVEKGQINPDYRDHIVNTQFRSYEFSPRVALWLKQGLKVPSETYSLDNVEDIPHVVTFTDNFGNCPTSILPEEIGFEAGKVIKTVMGDIPCYNRLKDVPNGEPGLIIGSWGIQHKRFIALVIQGKSAAAEYNLSSGSPIID
jgi:hypothetical protein